MPAVGAVAFRDGGQHRVVESRVPDLCLFRQQVSRLAEERALRVEHGAQHPGVEVLALGRRVEGHELATVGGRAADHGVQQHREFRVSRTPEACRVSVAERVHEQFERGPAAQWGLPREQAPITDMADPQSTSRTELRCPEPPGPSSRWMIDGSDGLALTRNGNSSITTTRGCPVTAEKSSAIASSQSCNGRLTLMPWRTSAAVNARRLTASVASTAGKYRPPVADVSASSRKLFPCRRRPLTTPSIAPGYAFRAKASSPAHSRSRSKMCSGLAVTMPPGSMSPYRKSIVFKIILLYNRTLPRSRG